MEKIKIENLYNLEETIAKDIFKGCTYPWEVLPKIKEYIIELGKTLDKEKFQEIKPNVWVAKSAEIAPTAYINGPCIIDEEATLRHCAFIRGSAIVGKKAVVGNSTELKNAILFNDVQVPHYNYVGDSIIGYKSHLGAGSKTCNLKSDKTSIEIKNGENIIKTGMRKIGAMVGDGVEVGCNSVLNPGTIIGKNTNIYPLSSVRGVINENSIYKNRNEIVIKQ